MPIRLRWFSIEPFISRDVSRLSEHLLSEKYTEERGWGFNLSDVRKDYVLGRYIVREKRIESFRDPIGETRSVEFEIFYDTEFRVQNKAPQLEVTSPARGLTEMFDHFGKCFDYTISITPVAVDPLRLLKKLKRDFEVVSMQKAVISDIELSPLSTATFILAGSEDVQKFFSQVVRGKKYALNSAIISFLDSGVEVKFEISRTGRLKVLNDDSSRKASFYRGYIAQLL
jgi:hypothetical protein